MLTLNSITVITDFLASLPHTGPEGFEGLVCRLCGAATGQRFRLSASGQQSGQDARTEPGIGNVIKVEAKHYEKSSLDSRELAAEMLQAVSSDPTLELWVLAASCAIKDQHAAQLEQHARTLNIEILLLDCGNEGLSRLVVLMAEFSQAVQNWIREFGTQASEGSVLSALTEIRSDQRFVSELARTLGKLRSTLLGYEDARRRANSRVLEVLANVGDAVATFGQAAAVRSNQCKVISRIGIADQLVSWWSKHTSSRRAVVLGEDGTGKTWAVLAWLAERIEADDLPIVLPLSANAGPLSFGNSLENVVPALLSRWTNVGTVASWEIRLKKWLRASTDARPLILIVIDGLNERPLTDWPLLLRTAEAREWRDHIAILTTDRPGHWRPQCATAGLDSFDEITIGGYTDSELQTALGGKGIRLSSIPGDLHPLIRKPRYCELVISHFDEMTREADFTVERLLFIDARSHAASRRGSPLTEEAFIEVIRNVARQYRETPIITLSTVSKLLPYADPERRLLQEIIDGGILVQQPGVMGSRFTVERTRLVFGLGLLLADEVRNLAFTKAERIQIEDEIAKWFEPHPEMDLKVEICGAALFHSLAETEYPTIGRRALLRYWLGLRNWGDKAQVAFADYVVRCPDDFIAVTKDIWSSSRDSGAAQSFLAGAFIKHRDDHRVQPVLVVAVHEWMSQVHSDGPPFFRPDNKRREECHAKISKRVGFELKKGETKICGHRLIVVDDEALLRLSRLGFLIISAGSRMPFINCLVSWAIASAVMGHSLETGLADWVVRLSDEQIKEALSAKIDSLLRTNNSVARTAAETLIYAFDPERARAMWYADEDCEWRGLRDQHAADPCTSLYPWTRADSQRCMEREDVHVARILGNISPFLDDPDFVVPPTLIKKVGASLNFAPQSFRTGLWATAETHAFDSALPLLASRAPGYVSEFVHRVVETIPQRSVESLYALALWLFKISPLLSASDVHTIRALSLQLQSEHSRVTSKDDAGRLRTADSFLLLALAPHLGSDDVFMFVINRPVESLDLLRFEPWFGILSDSMCRSALESLLTATDDLSTIRVLWVLAHSKPSLADSERARVATLANSKNRTVKGAAMRFACLADDEELGRRIAEQDVQHNTDREGWDSVWGPHCTVLFSARVPMRHLAKRLHPADLGFALKYRNFAADDVAYYGDLLDSCCTAILDATEPAVVSLPAVRGNPEKVVIGQIPEFHEDGEGGRIITNSSLSWGGARQRGLAVDEVREMFDGEQLVRRMNQTNKERAEATFAAWGTEALQWFGRTFSDSALEQVCIAFPQLARKWATLASIEGSRGASIRSRLGGFLSQLCTPLLTHDPVAGLDLWNALRKMPTGPTVFDAALAAFRANGGQAEFVRAEVLSECHDDASLSRISYLAEAYERQHWLNSTITSMLVAPSVRQRAVGLTLASFANTSPKLFGEFVHSARIENTWLEPQIETLQRQVLDNHYSRQWYRRYLSLPKAEESWGALQMFLRIADYRFFTWREAEESSIGDSADKRLRFVEANLELEKELNREKKRKETLFGLKIDNTEIFPFIHTSRFAV